MGLVIIRICLTAFIMTTNCYNNELNEPWQSSASLKKFCDPLRKMLHSIFRQLPQPRQQTDGQSLLQLIKVPLSKPAIPVPKVVQQDGEDGSHEPQRELNLQHSKKGRTCHDNLRSLGVSTQHCRWRRK